MRCLSCERHVLYRIVLQFSREAIIKQRHIPLLEKFKDTHNASITFETPELMPRSMKGGVATVIIDKNMPNQQKRTVTAFALSYKDLITKTLAEEDLDEGFIEIHEVSDVVELIEWEEYKPKKTCKPKKKKRINCQKCGLPPDLCACEEVEKEERRKK